jgi:Ca2+-transporting ATPase
MMRALRELQQQLPLSAETGLTAEGVARSRATFGPNRLTPLPREPLWKKFRDKFDEPIIKILLAAALLSMLVDLFKGSAVLGGSGLGAVVVAVGAAVLLRRSEWVPTLLFVSAVVLFFVGLFNHHWLVEGMAVMVAVILATGVAFLSEYRSDREFEALNAHKEALRVKVVRGGAFHTVPLDEVVVGDLVDLEMGDEVPADGRLVKATDLHVDQSLMTGESEPVQKKPRPDDTADGFEQPGCVYRGTQVVDGVGQMIATEVGDASYLGQIARRLSAETDEDEAEQADNEEQRVKHKLTISKELTPLQLKLRNLAELISNVGYVAAALIFIALLVRGTFFVEPREVFWPHSTAEALSVARNLLGYFVYMIIIIVVAVPEGLPMSVTVSLALAMQKMTRAHSLVRQLVACETIGSATVICSDKTGTLTQNKMQVVRLSWDGTVCNRGTPEWSARGAEAQGLQPLGLGGTHQPTRPLGWMAFNAAVNSTANLEDKDGKLLVVGNSTEGALLHWLRESGVDHVRLRVDSPPLSQLLFTSERKRMTTVIRQGDRLLALVKGAPEWVLEHSTHYLAGDGTVHPWTPEVRKAAQQKLRDASTLAMRTLAFAHAVLPPDTPADADRLRDLQEAVESGLVYTGFVGIRDPLRDDVKEAVDRCRRAGIEVKMITGDNVETARAVAYEIGLVDRAKAWIDTPRDSRIMTSGRFNELSDEELKQRLPELRVLARAKPLDKFRMVKLLQELGEVVAVTGDGTNDAPALKKADVGLAMGVAGTEVAKEASKIVLLDDSFATIVKAVQWGRSLYENIQRFLLFQLTINVSALTVAFLGPFFGVKPPFTVLQLLWINVIMDTFASIALCSEPPRAGLMDVPPKRKDESILTPAMLATMFTTAVFFVVVMMALLSGMEWQRWWAEPPGGGSPPAPDFPQLTVRQVSIFFTVYVFFQVWNQINCRSLVPAVSGLSGLFRNPTFLAIAATVAGVQVLIVSVPWLAAIFEVEPLGPRDWLWIVLGTSSVLVFAEIVRRVRFLLRRSNPVPKKGVSHVR